MTEIIKFISNEARVSHRVISKNTDVKEKNVVELIDKHIIHLKKFGLIPFETEKTENKGRPSKSYYLNEQQSTLLITFMRNNERVINFKVLLVKEFYKSRKSLENMKKNKELDINSLELYFKYFVNIEMINKLEYLYGKDKVKKFYSKLVPNLDYEKEEEESFTTEYFIKNCVLTEKGSRLNTTELYSAYLNFCMQYKIETENKINFFKTLRDIKNLPKINLLHVGRFNGKRKRYFENLKVVF